MERSRVLISFRHTKSGRHYHYCYFCEVCQAKPQTVDTLNAHIGTAKHQWLAKSVRGRVSFVCYLCDGKSFGSLTALVQHASSADRHNFLRLRPNIANLRSADGVALQGHKSITLDSITASPHGVPVSLDVGRSYGSESAITHAVDLSVEQLQARSEQETLLELLGSQIGPQWTSPCPVDSLTVLERLESNRHAAETLSKCWESGYDLESYAFPDVLHIVGCDYCKGETKKARIWLPSSLISEPFADVEFGNRTGSPPPCRRHYGVLHQVLSLTVWRFENATPDDDV